MVDPAFSMGIEWLEESLQHGAADIISPRPFSRGHRRDLSYHRGFPGLEKASVFQHNSTLPHILAPRQINTLALSVSREDRALA
jgi:hypothetical protein